LDNAEQLTEYSEINSTIPRVVGEEFLQFTGGKIGQQSDPLQLFSLDLGTVTLSLPIPSCCHEIIC